MSHKNNPIPPVHATPPEELAWHPSQGNHVPRRPFVVEPEPPAKSTTRSDDLPPGHPGFLSALDEMEALHRRKGADYSVGDDFLANVRAAGDFGVPPWVGAMIRANDKIIRIKAAAQGSALRNEGVEDSLMDLAAYALIALVLYREQNGS